MEKFNSEMLKTSYDNSVAEEKNDTQIINSHSFMYTLLFVNAVSNNMELAKQYGITEKKVEMVKDFYGINSDRRRLSIKAIAEKYGETESRTQAMLAKTLLGINKFAKAQSNGTQISK